METVCPCETAPAPAVARFFSRTKKSSVNLQFQLWAKQYPRSPGSQVTEARTCPVAFEWGLVWLQKTSFEVGQPCGNFIKFSLITRLADGVGAGPAETQQGPFALLNCVVFITSRKWGVTFDTHDVKTGLGISQSSESDYIPHPMG